ncbi:MAG: hypothetical protein WBC29_00095 [Candidatus Moraniibacteriota bacterium]
MPFQSSSGSNKVLFWSLVALAIAMILAVAFALRGFNREMDKDSSLSNSPNMSKDDVKDVPPSEVMTEEVLMGWKRDEQNHISVTGEVLGVRAVPEQKDVKGMELDLKVSPIIDSLLYPAPDKLYRFFLSERDTKEGFSESFKVGDTVTVTSQANPTEDAYVIGEKVGKELGVMSAEKTGEGMMQSGQ